MMFYEIQAERSKNIKGIREFLKCVNELNIFGVGILKYIIWKDRNWYRVGHLNEDFGSDAVTVNEIF